MSASAAPHCRVGTDLKTLAWLAEVVPNCLVASYDMHSEQSVFWQILPPYTQRGVVLRNHEDRIEECTVEHIVEEATATTRVHAHL